MIKEGPIYRTQIPNSTKAQEDMHKQQKSESSPNMRKYGSPHMRRIISEFCRNAADDYRRAGCPMGRSVEGMLVWFEFDQKTTRN